MDNKEKTYKISQLPEMLSSDISGDDLFIMSDYNGGECKSKKLNFHQLNAFIASSKQVKHEISAEITDALRILDGGSATDF